MKQKAKVPFFLLTYDLAATRQVKRNVCLKRDFAALCIEQIVQLKFYLKITYLLWLRYTFRSCWCELVTADIFTLFLNGV